MTLTPTRRQSSAHDARRSAAGAAGPAAATCALAQRHVIGVGARARRKVRSLWSLSWRDRGLVAEAVLMLAAARAALRLLPFRWFQPWLTLDRAADGSDAALVVRVGRAVNIASRNLPFNAVCLPQAMAAKVMLARRGAGSSLVIGAARDADGQLLLHAWLEAGGTIVTGAAARSAMTPVARFN